MEQLGEIKSILNDDMVLISSDKKLNVNDILTVFAAITSEDTEKDLGIKNIIFPKGKIKIICAESEIIYLASRFRESSERRRTVTEPSHFQRSLIDIVRAIVPQQREVVETIYGPWSAEFDKEKSLNIEFSSIITIGDLVGRI